MSFKEESLRIRRNIEAYYMPRNDIQLAVQCNKCEDKSGNQKMINQKSLSGSLGPMGDYVSLIDGYCKPF